MYDPAKDLVQRIEAVSDAAHRAATPDEVSSREYYEWLAYEMFAWPPTVSALMAHAKMHAKANHVKYT
jgi:hypothetical protein